MRRLLSAFCLLVALGLAAPAYAKFKVVTTFTVIQDIAQNRARKSMIISPRRKTLPKRNLPIWCCGTG